MSVSDSSSEPASKRQCVPQRSISPMEDSPTEEHCHNFVPNSSTSDNREPSRGLEGEEECLCDSLESQMDGNSSQDLFSDASLSPVKKTESIEEVVDDAEKKEDGVFWCGVPVESLRCLPNCEPQHQRIRPSATHTVTFKIPLEAGQIPQPHPDRNVDRWDDMHVKMPHSRDNLYPVDNGKGKRTLCRRWDVIQEALLKNMISSLDLEEAILSYNMRCAGKWNFRGLHAFFTEVLEPEETNQFFSVTLPAMVKLALRLPQLLTAAIPLLKRGTNHSISLSQLQIASLLANAFFCTFPRRNAQRKQGTEYSTFPDINFNRLFAGTDKGYISRVAEKLKCLLNYFRRVTTEEPEGVVTFSRQHVTSAGLPSWEESQKLLPALHITSRGLIEREGHGMLQMDFANKFVGGGVLGWGCVQEEIRFVICPELIISRLFTEVLERTESFVITGAECYSFYSGYADSFRWEDNFIDCSHFDEDRRRCTTVVAVDATHFYKKEMQYKPEFLHRELTKAFVGFCNLDCPSGKLVAVATGNWGCGAFNGDPKLKALLQLMAAAEAGRDVMYFTFGDTQLRDQIFHMYTFLKEKHVTIGELWWHLRQYSSLCFKEGRYILHLYNFLYSCLKSYDNNAGRETEQEQGSLSSVVKMTAITKPEASEQKLQRRSLTASVPSRSQGREPKMDCQFDMTPTEFSSSRHTNRNNRCDLRTPQTSLSHTEVLSVLEDSDNLGNFDGESSEDEQVLIQHSSSEPRSRLLQCLDTLEQDCSGQTQKKISEYFKVIPK